MPHVLALDEGTTSARAIVFDHDGGIKAVAQREFRQIFPKPGWVEHDASEIWSTQIAVAIEALAQARVKPREVAAVGITNQRETTVVWDRKTGEPIHNAIVWQDRRTAGVCDKLRAAGAAKVFQRKTGLVLDAYFSGTKVAWILDNVTGARKRAARGELAFGTIDTWLAWKLTSGKLHITDPSNASRTLMFNINTGDWDDELLKILRVPRSMLPEVRSSSEAYGEISTSLGLGGVPLAGIAGDQQSALFGQMCNAPGMAKNTYGTGCFMLQNVGDKPVPSRNRLLSTVAWKIGDKTQYALEGSVFIGGAVVQWLRDGLGWISSSAEVEDLAMSVPDTGGVYLVPAFAGLGAPYWDQYARGAIVGLTRGTTKAHIARAALEGIAHQVADLLDAMHADTAGGGGGRKKTGRGAKVKELRVDGGASRNDLLMQFQADMLGVPVVRPAVTETTASGAAYLAGLAVGYWKSVSEIASQWKAERRFEPTMPRKQAQQHRERWAEALQRSMAWEPKD